MPILNINNGALIVSASSATGIADIEVLNGAWEGKLDWDNKLIWADLYPERKWPFTSAAPAKQGDCPPYY